MKTKSVLLFIVAIAVTLGGVWIYQGGNIGSPADISDNDSTSVFQPPVAQSPGSQFSGDVGVNVQIANVGNNTAGTDATTVDINYYQKLPDGTWNFIGTSASNTLDIPVFPGFDILWAEVEHKTGQSFVTDWKKTVEANGGCVNGQGKVCNPDFADANKDNVNSYIFPVDLTRVKANADPNIKPELTWFVKLQGDQNAVFNAPSSLTGVGTGQVEKIIEWDYQFDHQPGAESLSAVQFRINKTDDTKWFPLKSSIQIASDTPISLASMDVSKDYTNTITIYKKTFGYDVNGAKLITVPSVGSKNVDFNVILTTNFASGDDMCVEIEATVVSALGAYAEDTDDVEITNDSTVSAECSITDD